MNDITATFYSIINGIITPVQILIRQPYEENGQWHSSFELYFGEQLIHSMNTYRTSNFGALLSMIGLLRNILEQHLQHHNTALYQNEEEAVEGRYAYPLNYLFHDRSLSNLEQNPLHYTRDLTLLENTPGDE